MRNVHQRTLEASAARVGTLIDGLAGEGDQLWPKERWPPLRFDAPLGPGAAGGHGPIRYVVDEYEPGRRIVCRFTAPRGFRGTHGFEVEDAGGGRTVLRHVLQMRTTGLALLSWPLVFRPLHDALIEDALDRAERSVGMQTAGARWSPWVRRLRRMLRGRGR